MRRGYRVTTGNLDDNGEPEAPTLLQTTCYRAALDHAAQAGAVVLPICDEDVTVLDTCDGCTPWCREFPAPRKGRKPE
jgi:hypothetical protein